jgi:hypothetical protein
LFGEDDDGYASWDHHDMAPRNSENRLTDSSEWDGLVSNDEWSPGIGVALAPNERASAGLQNQVALPRLASAASMIQTAPMPRASTAARVASGKRRPRRGALGYFWLAACLLIAGGLGASALLLEEGSSPSVLGQQELAGVATPIEQIRVGQRVVANSPDLAASDHDDSTAVDPSTWKLVRLYAEERWSDGTVDDIHVETLQPQEWLSQHNVQVGGAAPIPLDLVEMGMDGGTRARVEAIEPCPPLEPAPGRLILTTINHLNRYVVELTVENAAGRREIIQPTGFHKIYRASDQAWVSAADLQPGDALTGLSGPLTVVSVEQTPGTHRVYNFTVKHEHVYDVGGLGLLVHNDCPSPNGQKGAPDHQDAVKDLLAEKAKEFPKQKGFEVTGSASIVDTGVNRKPDVVVRGKDGKVVEVGEVAKSNQDGSMVSRERKKQGEYDNAGIPSDFRQLPPKAQK